MSRDPGSGEWSGARLDQWTALDAALATAASLMISSRRSGRVEGELRSVEVVVKIGSLP